MRLEGPGTATYFVDDATARRDRWSEGVVGAEPKQARSSPIEKAAVGEVPSEAAARVDDRRKQKRDSKDAKRERLPGQKLQSGTGELSADQEHEIAKLAEIDRAVRAHEAAHMAAAGGLAKGAATFSYRTGPDGKQYAVGGEVQIDLSPVDGSPEATMQRAQQAANAALAPADPSPQDRVVAAEARRMLAEARRELAAKSQEEASGGDSTSTSSAEGTDSAVPGATGQRVATDQESKPVSKPTVGTLRASLKVHTAYFAQYLATRGQSVSYSA